MVRRVESNYIYINKIPQAEYQAYIALIAKAEQVWEQAREANDFSGLLPIWSGLWIPSASPDRLGYVRAEP